MIARQEPMRTRSGAHRVYVVCPRTAGPRRPSPAAYDHPVKRSDALSPLSREHHVALEVALRLRRASADDAANVQAGFLTFFDDGGREHFRIEELLIPAFARYAGDEDPDVLRVLDEHREIGRRAQDLAQAAGDVEGFARSVSCSATTCATRAHAVPAGGGGAGARRAGGSRDRVGCGGQR